MIRENFKVYKAIIIGAGASGMVASIELGKAFKGENIPFLMRDRLRWATPVLPSADAYAAVGHRDYSRIGL